MGNDTLQPYLALGMAGILGLAFTVWAIYHEDKATFAQRWAPAYQIEHRMIDVRPVPLPIPPLPKANWNANPGPKYRLAVNCNSFCEFP